MKKKYINMRVLNFDRCKYLTQVPDVSGLPNLEEFSFQFCENVITIHNSIGLLDKLKILSAEGCSKLKSFPPLKLASLQYLGLSYCTSLESFPDILGKMENIAELSCVIPHLKELPFSFQNHSHLQKLFLRSCRTVQLPSSITMMPKLAKNTVDAEGMLLSPKPDKVGEKVNSLLSSNVECLSLSYCSLSTEFLEIGLTWFVNVKELDLRGNNFTIVPECLKECRFLWILVLDDCKKLHEIRGIPPSLKYLSAIDCESLTSSCRNMLLNQELHEAGNTRFLFARNKDSRVV